jgi:hypothetical protein
MMGGTGVTCRVGRGLRLRECLAKGDSRRLANERNQLSYDYRHGTDSDGAFTFAMVRKPPRHLRNHVRATDKTHRPIAARPRLRPNTVDRRAFRGAGCGRAGRSSGFQMETEGVSILARYPNTSLPLDK